MPQIVILPHVELCPEGAVLEAKPLKTICDTLLDAGIEIEHACEKSGACTTCHIIVREGFDALEQSQEGEDDLLDKAWGLESTSRLSCQAKLLKNADLVIEIPKYSINFHMKQTIKREVESSNEVD
ncbi:ISC system 2Fe-2S type ferredoxin [Candidatus Vallotia tarda]|uniref:2Fe-2S ferredoxin n=1 Tax=Candidatus Vallotiella hemipterorum TaxID=1177213 RepID=A0A916JVQ9_9BURK|nr:ISC system 2Fe-2S type ferredoxin [Candidatus Vallotia tarda]CAG7601582.1 2Fe-2S ferredoxin [Candidatus Vallotia tarda]